MKKKTKESDSGRSSGNEKESGNESAKESESGRENERERGSAGGKIQSGFHCFCVQRKKFSVIWKKNGLICVSVSGQDLEVETDTGTSALTRITPYVLSLSRLLRIIYTLMVQYTTANCSYVSDVLQTLSNYI